VHELLYFHTFLSCAFCYARQCGSVGADVRGHGDESQQRWLNLMSKLLLLLLLVEPWS
jgi:hypothetical protein